MSFLDRFRPQWKNTDPEARAHATRELGPDMSAVLAEIANTDDDARVRRIAIKRLEDPALLRGVAEAQEDPKIREAAEERAAALLLAAARGDEPEAAQKALAELEQYAPGQLAEVALQAPLEAVRQEALQSLSRIKNDAGLAQVARQAQDLEVRREALGQVAGPEALADLARSLDHGELALAALERVEDPETLRRLADGAAVKAVRDAAAARLPAPTAVPETAQAPETPEAPEAPEAPETAEEPTEKEESAPEAADAETPPETQAEAPVPEEQPVAEQPVEEQPVEEQPVEEQPVEEQPVEEQPAQEQPVAEQPAQAGADEETPPETQEQSAPPLSEGQQARLDLCHQVEELEGDSIPAGIEAVEAAWTALAPLPDGEGEGKDDLNLRFQRAITRARERHQRWEAGAEHRAQQAAIVTEAEALAASEDLESAQEAWQAIRGRWKEATPKSVEIEPEIAERFHVVEERFAALRAEERQQMEQRKNDNLARLEGLTKHLEGMTEQEELNLRKAERRLREAQIALRSPGPLPSKREWESLKPRLHKAREALVPRVRELEQLDEWQRWANVPIQENLGGKMEALVEEKDLGKAAKEMRRLMEEWKKAARVPQHKSEELWQRFITARDKVKEKVDVYFARLAEERKENLAKKRALCEQAEALQESDEWNKTADALKALQADWKKIGPVPRKHSDTVWKRFRTACDHFFDRRKERFDALQSEREENLAKKEALVEKAEALQGSTDWNAGTDAFKRLQSEWKTIGPVPRKHSDAIWKRFRAACDYFFDRRSRKDELHLEDNIQEREEILTTLEGLLPGKDAAEGEAGSTEDLAEQIKESRGRWRAAGQVPGAVRKALADRYAKVSTALMAAYPNALEGTELDPKAVAERREKILADLEALLEEQREAQGDADEATIQDLAAQLKAALASNTIRRGAVTTGGGPEQKAAERKLKILKNRWQDLPGEAEGAAAKRYQGALKELDKLLG